MFSLNRLFMVFSVIPQVVVLNSLTCVQLRGEGFAFS